MATKTKNEAVGVDAELAPNNINAAENGAQGENVMPECTHWAYIGPSLPNGALKQSTMFFGTKNEVLTYLADQVEAYPAIVKLIIPAEKIGVYKMRLQTTGNIVHKHYEECVKAIALKARGE